VWVWVLGVGAEEEGDMEGLCLLRGKRGWDGEGVACRRGAAAPLEEDPMDWSLAIIWATRLTGSAIAPASPWRRLGVLCRPLLFCPTLRAV